MTHTTVAVGDTEYVFPTIIRSYYKPTNHQLEKRQRMDNYVCMSFQATILILISMVINLATLGIIMYMTKRQCNKGIRI